MLANRCRHRERWPSRWMSLAISSGRRTVSRMRNDSSSGALVAAALSSERARRLPRRNPAPHPELQREALRLSQRGAAMFQAGGVRESLAPRPFVSGVPETRSFPL
jgi:hypothetical protein